MRWFNHGSEMSTDPKIQNLIDCFGAEGYGLYLYILERISLRLGPKSLVADMEETAGDIAAELHMDTLKVEEIIDFCVRQELLEHDNNSGSLRAPFRVNIKRGGISLGVEAYEWGPRHE